FVNDIGAAMSAALVHIGDRLGLYRALATAGPSSIDELAARTRTAPRMVREWLMNQAASGYVHYDSATGRYSMTPEQAMLLAEEESPANMQGAFDIITSLHRDADKIEQAFRTGRGFAWGDHDTCLFCGTERFFASNYRANLLNGWIPAIAGMR